MTSKHQNQMSRRYPLKRVRPDNENQSSTLKTTGRFSKKLCREPSEDSAFFETEKSSDERAFDLFYKEYFCQIRVYFKHRSIASQLIEHLWTNMGEQSKVSFIRKVLREQGLPDIQTNNFNDENDFESTKSLNESNLNQNETLHFHNKYSRGFIQDFLSYLKCSIAPRSNEINLKPKTNIPLRRSSRIRRAPIKCVCSTCITTGGILEHSVLNDDIHNKVFRELIEHYHRLDDQFIEGSNSILLINDDVKLNETDKHPIDQMLQAEIIEKETEMNVTECKEPLATVVSDEYPFPLVEPVSNSNEQSAIVTTDCLTENEQPATRRTFVILTELDEPFFGPYPIEFTITI